MRGTEEESYGKHTLRFEKFSSGWKGVVFGRAKEPREGPTKEAVRTELHRLVDAAHPQFIGYEGAIYKFRRIFLNGFEDREYLEVRERREKVEAAGFCQPYQSRKQSEAQGVGPPTSPIVRSRPSPSS